MINGSLFLQMDLPEKSQQKKSLVEGVSTPYFPLVS